MRIKMPAERCFGNGIHVKGSLALQISHESPHRVNEFRAASVIESERQPQAGIGSGLLDRSLKVFLDWSGKAADPPNRFKADVVLVELRNFLAQVFAKQLHQQL